MPPTSGFTAAELPKRISAYWSWALFVWVLLTWTRTWSQLLFGLGFSLLVAFACVPFGPAGGPWRLLHPRRLAAAALLAATALARIVRANVSLARRIWLPSRPLRPGMVVVPTELDSILKVTVVGLVTSVIVDNQIVDTDLERHELQYHAIWIDSEDPEENRRHINGPIEGPLSQVAGR